MLPTVYHNRVGEQQYKSQAFRQVNVPAVLHMFPEKGPGLKRAAQHHSNHHIDYGLMAHIHMAASYPRPQKKTSAQAA